MARVREGYGLKTRKSSDPIVPEYTGQTAAGGAVRSGAPVPAYTGAGGGNFFKQVLTPVSQTLDKAIGGLNSVMRQRMEQQPERTHARQLNSLVKEGWYTPAAELSMYNVKAEASPGTPGRMAYSDADNKVLYRPDYFTEKNYDPAAAAEDLRHEYGHFFDRGGRRSGAEFQGAARKTDAEFYPGMGLKPLLDMGGIQWGGPKEAYADVGRNPYWFKALRKYYPQYTNKAYVVPPYAGQPGNWINENRTWQFEPTAGRGPYTDIANRVPGKAISMDRSGTGGG